ncbi:hypothetical protein H2203_000452 [Taxawa tesnikishii (nom. ined.)]|nr:hypothetical protein H2203_000452 [Dothideales sp. JES 119]
MPRRAQRYKSLDSFNAERDAIAWYWRLTAYAASWMILGGFLTLPATFDQNPQLRVNKNVLSIFSVAVLTAGISLTGLVCFACRSLLFQADSIFLPSLTSCAIGLLTIFYSFLVSTRYVWNTSALLLTIAAALSTVIYGALLLIAHRRISAQKLPDTQAIPLRLSSFGSSGQNYQDPSYYRNYAVNMWPASRLAQTPATPAAPVEEFNEDELTRQQMLQLLLTKSEPAPSPDPSQHSFNRIEWRMDQEDVFSPDRTAPPIHGYYAPQHMVHPQPVYPPSGYAPPHAQYEIENRQWDRAVRGGSADVRTARNPGRPMSREERRFEIEQGR